MTYTIETTGGSFEGDSLWTAVDKMAAYYAENYNRDVPRVIYTTENGEEVTELYEGWHKWLDDRIEERKDAMVKENYEDAVIGRAYERSVSNRDGR